MSTISNERLEKLSEYDCADRYEVMSMATELLALRKERDKVEPVLKAAEKLVRCKGRYHSEQNYRALAALFGVTTPDLPPLEGEALRERAEPAYYLNQIDYGDGEGFELRAYFREVDAMKSKDDFGGVVIPAYTAPPATDKVADTAVCPKCGDTGLADSGGVQPWGEPILIECDCTAPPAPDIADDSLPYDPQIAEYEQMMEAEQAQAGTTAQQFESLAGKAVVPEGWKLVPIELTKEMRGKIHPFAEALCHGCGREVVADCEDNVTASWNDMLAVAPTPVGKQSSTAEGNNDGFECTPVADLYELLTKCGECYDYTTSAKVAADWIKEGYSAREYVKLDRLQEAMTLGSSGEPDGWIPCSERMPPENTGVLVATEFDGPGDWRMKWGTRVPGHPDSKNGWFIPGASWTPSHWQPLPEPPCK